MDNIPNKQDINALVQKFYAAVRQDDMLGPIFATKIKPDGWDSHIAHIATFWESIFLKTGAFSGNPLQKHLAIHGITPAHFAHWLALFQKTALEVLTPEKAKTMRDMAQRIAQSLQMGIAVNYEKNGVSEHPFKDFGLGSRG